MAAEFDYGDLKKKYGDFQFPVVVINVGGNDLATVSEGLQVTDIVVESSVGFEAGIASFSVGGTWDRDEGCFKSKVISKYLKLGAGVSIAAGYSQSAKTIFVGYICRLNYVFQKGSLPGVRVSCMDIKGLMMSGTYSRQLKDITCYSEAVSSIFQKYQSGMKGTSPAALVSVIVDDTPDKSSDTGGSASGGQKEPSARTIEMVDESDYEFVVKCAKKYNYEFLVSAGVVAFRKARSNEDILLEIDLQYFKNIDVEQNSVGQVEKVEVRAISAGDGKLLTASQKTAGTGTKQLKKIIAGTKKVYIDPSCDSKEDLGYRAEYLMQENAYKFVTMRATVVGLPEFTAGRFFNLGGLYEDGGMVKFYIQEVIQRFDGEKGYETDLICRAMTMDKI